MPMSRRILSIDIETYSDVDIKGGGAYAYASSPNFEVLLMAYAYDDEPVQIVDFANFEQLPWEVMRDLVDANIVKTAYNANFERTCLSKYLGIVLLPEQWQCTAVHGAVLGFPQHLDGIAKALNMGEDKQKMTAGKALIRYFCIPCKPTKTNGQRTRNHPEHDMEKWELFKEYCKQDVEVERAVRKKLEKFPLNPVEYDLWCLDQKINDGGINLDYDLVKNAIQCDAQNAEKLEGEAKELTGLENPNSVAQLSGWLREQGLEVKSVTKETVKDMLAATDNPTVKRVLGLRQEMAKTSVKKYEAMDRALCPDGRVRGLLQFYGANRTGRWAGRLVQVQNLPQNKLDDLDLARELLKLGDYESLEMLFNNVPDTLSQLIRTAFIPSEGCRFIVSDFSAIEARVIAWLAGEQWRLDVFEEGGDIYCASASQMFKVPVEKHGVNSHLRQKGKIAELALGYQGGVGALTTMGALKMGIAEEELPDLVSSWREANPTIVNLWKSIEDTAKKCISGKQPMKYKNLVFSYESGIMFVKLPSGRRLAYVKAGLEVEEKFNRKAITYYGVDQTKKTWGKLYTYGGKLVENIVQAIARDCLRDSMLALDKEGFSIVMHVHDEVVLDVPIGESSVDAVAEIMGRPLPWAQGLPLRADGYETEFYRKD